MLVVTGCCRRRRRRKKIPAPIRATAASKPTTMPAIAPPCRPEECGAPDGCVVLPIELGEPVDDDVVEKEEEEEDDRCADVVVAGAATIEFHPLIATAATLTVVE